MRWAVDNGADVINMSLTRNTQDWPESWDDAFMYAFEHDVVVVAAAGNRGSGTSEVGAPATIPGVLTVAGVDPAKNASFDASSQGITIAVAAPSEDLVGVLPDGSYVQWSGTSGAAPIVVGPRRARPLRVPRPRRRERDQADHSHGRPARARGAEPVYGYGHHRPGGRADRRCPRGRRRTRSASLAEWITHAPASGCPGSATDDEARTIVPIADPPLPRSDGAQTLLPTRGRSRISRSRSRSSQDLVR